MAISKVIVVGAGPSGLLLAVLLARTGINVELLEMTSGLDTNPRASHYTRDSCLEFDRAGILDEVRAQGFLPDGVSWRKLDADRTRLGFFRSFGDNEDPENRYRMVCLPLHKLGKVLEKALLAQPTAKIWFDHKVVGLGQEDDNAWVDVESPKGKVRMEADFVVGCDGANSGVRRLLFGDEYPGRTWDEQIVATNVYYDFSPYDYDDSNFFIDPEHWHMVAKITSDGLYRVTYGEKGGLNYDELKERQPGKFQAFLPGNPTPDKYTLVNFSPYRVHQRCALKMRVGRFLLAADAAHLCNPWGGLGLTGGIADIGGLYDCFVGMHTGRASSSILDKYDEIRRQIWHDVINPISCANMRRVFDQNPDTALEDDEFLKRLKLAEVDENVRQEMQKAAGMSLRHDMTQYYGES